MGHGHNKAGIPSGNIVREKALFQRVMGMLDSTITYADALAEARKGLLESGRLRREDPKASTLALQCRVLEEVVNNCLRVTPEELKAVLDARDKEKFQEQVNKLMDLICPLVILTPSGFRIPR